MRRHSKSYDLIPFKDHRNKGECKRIYDYLDNRKLIIDYLTERVFKMVEKTGDSKKYRRPYCGFWKALRSTRCLDMKMTPDEVKKLSADTSKGEYNDAENMWYFYDATYEITNNAKFTMPKAA